MRRDKLHQDAARQRQVAEHYCALAAAARDVADRIVYEECASRALEHAELLDRQADEIVGARRVR